MVEFLETPRFDVNISYGSAGGPGFNTAIFEGHGGVEQRGITWATAKGKWNVGQGIRDSADMKTIRALFMAVKGRAIGFRFKDWNDFELVAEPASGTANGSNPTFKIIKTYTAGSLSYVRRIFKPVSGSLVIKDNGVTRTIGVGAGNVAVDYTTGVLTFGASIIPAAAHVITVDGEFDTPVRFDTDNMTSAMDGFQTESWSSIPLVELLLEDV